MGDLESSRHEYPLKCSENEDDDGHTKRTGTALTASAHIITAVIGSGVLSLAWSMAQLGWIAGPIVLIAFAFVTYYTSLLLADCYRHPHPITGIRNYTYMDAVRSNLGGVHIWLCGLAQYTNLVGTTIGYSITASISMVAIQRSNCFHKEGEDAPCHISNNPYMILFGTMQLFLSQLPDFHRIWWLSIVASIMSFSYAIIGIGLSIAKALEGGHSYGALGGIGLDVVSRQEKIWLIFQALGDIAFAYSYALILIEIQNTLKSSPPENKTMKKASLIGVATTTLFYMVSGCVGYAAFGNNAPGNLLTGFGFYNPFWLVDFANASIVVHLVCAYQVFSQPIYACVEEWVASRFPKNRFVKQDHEFAIPLGFLFGSNGGGFRCSINLFRVTWRSGYVVIITLIAMLLPFFNDILGILGALGFWPLTVYFPIQMHIAQGSVRRWSPKWCMLQLLSICCLLITSVAFIGSLAGVVQDLKFYIPFKTQY